MRRRVSFGMGIVTAPGNKLFQDMYYVGYHVRIRIFIDSNRRGRMRHENVNYPFTHIVARYHRLYFFGNIYELCSLF